VKDTNRVLKNTFSHKIASFQQKEREKQPKIKITRREVDIVGIYKVQKVNLSDGIFNSSEGW